MHEEIEERRLVVLVDELKQRGEARAHAALVGREAPGREVTGAERLENGGGGQLARAQRDVDAAREDRIDERDGVADGDEAIAYHRRVVVGEVGHAVHRRDADGAREILGHAPAAGDHRVEQALGLARPLLHGARVADGAHARDVAGERDPPEPALAEDVDADVTFLEARPPRRAFVVREQRDLAEVRNARAPAVTRGQERVAPGGVHEHLRPHAEPSALAAHRQGHPAGVELRPLHRGRLEHGDAALRRVLEQHGVEFGARDLVGVVRPRLARQEVERLRRGVVVLVDEGRAVLQLKPALLDGRPGAELLQEQHGGRHQRLTDVEAREPLALEERHAQPAVGEEGCRARAARPAAHDHDVEGLHQDRVQSVFTATTGVAACASSLSCE